jgi:hypothetical protein
MMRKQSYDVNGTAGPSKQAVKSDKTVYAVFSWTTQKDGLKTRFQKIEKRAVVSYIKPVIIYSKLLNK